MFVVLRITNDKNINMDLKNLKPANKENRVLGTGSAKCKALEKATNETVAIVTKQMKAEGKLTAANQ